MDVLRTLGGRKRVFQRGTGMVCLGFSYIKNFETSKDHRQRRLGMNVSLLSSLAPLGPERFPSQGWPERNKLA